MEGARCHGGRGRPRDRAAQRPVHLDRGGVELEAPHRPHRPARQVLVGDQAAVETGRHHVGQHRVPDGDPVAVGGPHGHRAAAGHLDPRSPRCRTGSRRRGPGSGRASACESRPAPPSGTGKPTVCPSIDIRTPIRPEPAASRGMSACPALPASSSPGAVAAEQAAPQVGSGGAAACGRGRGRRRERSRASAAEAVPHRRERRDQRPHQVRADPVPPAAELEPGRTVTGVVRLHHPGRDSRSRCSRAQDPSGRGCPSTAGACTHRRPWSSSRKDCSASDAAASG